jgi:hypothetical protein
MKKGILLITFFGVFTAQAQYAEDALRFSRNYFGGTARMLGMAGAQQALGADISTLVGNPAGLGMYRSNDFSISPNLRFHGTESSAFGTLSSEQKDNFNIGSFGVNITQMNRDFGGGDRTEGWVSYSFGFGINRINNYHEDLFFTGNNTGNGSISQFYAEGANTMDTTDIFDAQIFTLEEMAWQGYAYDYDVANDRFVPLGTGPRRQRQVDQIEGAQNEWTFGFGANYSNTIYLGASLGIGAVRYERSTKFTEDQINDPIYNLRAIRLNERLRVEGNSVNLKIGTIIRPIDAVRFGISMQTPDYYNFDERFITDVNTDANGTSNYFNSLEYLFQYELRTPFKYSGGVAFFLKQMGILSADIEVLDYASNRLRGGGFNSDFGPAQNAEIESLYQSTVNYRMGAEFKLGDLSLRGGYALYGDPFKSAIINQSRQFITAGAGIRVESYYVDFAYVNQQYESSYSPYFLEAGNEPVVRTEHAINSFTLTLGMRF